MPRWFTGAIDVHHTHSPDAATVEHQRRVEGSLRALRQNQEALLIDTSKLLESARRQTTDNASLRELIASVKDQLTKTKDELAAAIAAGDPAAIAAAQKDIDDTVAKLDADDAETAAALGANVTPTPAPGDGTQTG